MRRRLNDDAEEIDEHNQPTEPFDIRLSPFARTVTDDRASADTTFSTTPAPSMFRPQMSVQPPAIGAYPYLPPASIRQDEKAGRPAGGVNASGNASVATDSIGKRRALFPALVGLCFVAVQVLLLVSFVLKMIGMWGDTAWVSVISLLSDLFVWPLQALLRQLPLPFTPSMGIVTLVAILLYGVFSRILVHGLKLLFRSR